MFTVTVLAFYIILPLGQRATNDLANIMTHAAERWSLIEVNARSQFAEKILEKHSLIIMTADKPLAESSSILPYLFFLKKAIEKHQQAKIKIKQSQHKNGKTLFWVDIPVNNQMVRFGFLRDRIGVQPPLALMIVLLAGLIITLITAGVLTRRLTIPIERLYHAAHDIGKGHWPEPIKEEGPRELKVLVHTFNRMSRQVKELLANRTTLLAGIAHDLRTPLTQIQLSLEMLPKNGGDSELMKSIKTDLDSINHLIRESLSIGIELAEDEKEEFDLGMELEAMIHHYPQDKISIYHPQEKGCTLHIQVLALRRVISNLLENAIRYSGENTVVNIHYVCNKEKTTLTIEDRGPGIPKSKMEAVFQPFYRLEQSRSSGTGGSGLGLAIVRQLADSHGWLVELKARQGGGTSATIIIPKHDSNYNPSPSF